MINSRTYPTIKPLANMNRSAQKFEIKIGTVQFMMLVGFLMGCMALSYLFGFYAGRTAGYTLAASDRRQEAVRLPALSDDNSSRVENEPVNVEKAVVATGSLANRNKEQEREVVNSQKVTNSENGADVGLSSLKGELALNGSESDSLIPSADLEATGAKLDDKAPVVKVLGTPAKDQSQEETLGSIGVVKDAVSKESISKESIVKSADQSHAVVQDQGKPTLPAKSALVKPEPNKTEQAKAEGIAKVAIKPIPTVVEKKVPVEEPIKQMASDAPTSHLPNGWFAQVAAPRKMLEARTISQRLRAAGFRTVIENASVRGDEYFRVLVGPEASRPQAERLLQQLKREGTGAGEPFLRVVK